MQEAGGVAGKKHAVAWHARATTSNAGGPGRLPPHLLLRLQLLVLAGGGDEPLHDDGLGALGAGTQAAVVGGHQAPGEGVVAQGGRGALEQGLGLVALLGVAGKEDLRGSAWAAEGLKLDAWQGS